MRPMLSPMGGSHLTLVRAVGGGGKDREGAFPPAGQAYTPLSLHSPDLCLLRPVTTRQPDLGRGGFP